MLRDARPAGRRAARREGGRESGIEGDLGHDETAAVARPMNFDPLPGDR